MLDVLKPRNVWETLYWGWRSAAWWERLLFVPLAVREYWRYFHSGQEADRAHQN
jgi:hypothetical protein